jgi:hypothetical protein
MYLIVPPNKLYSVLSKFHNPYVSNLSGCKLLVFNTRRS